MVRSAIVAEEEYKRTLICDIHGGVSEAYVPALIAGKHRPPHPPLQPCNEGCRAGAPSSPWPSPRKPATLRASTLDDALAALIVRRLRRPLRVHPGVRGVDLALMLVSPRAPRRQPRDRPSISHRICAVEPEANSKRNRDPGPTSTCVREPRGGPQRVWMHWAHPRGHPRARGKKVGGQPFVLRQAPTLAAQRRCKLRRRMKRTRSRKHPDMLACPEGPGHARQGHAARTGGTESGGMGSVVEGGRLVLCRIEGWPSSCRTLSLYSWQGGSTAATSRGGRDIT